MSGGAVTCGVLESDHGFSACVDGRGTASTPKLKHKTKAGDKGRQSPSQSCLRLSAALDNTGNDALSTASLSSLRSPVCSSWSIFCSFLAWVFSEIFLLFAFGAMAGREPRSET